MLWPLAADASLPLALLAARQDVAEVCEQHGFRVADGHYRVVEADAAVNGQRHVEFTGTAVHDTTLFVEPQPRLSDEWRQAVMDLREGFALSLTAEHGLKLIPDWLGDAYLASIPSADNDVLPAQDSGREEVGDAAFSPASTCLTPSHAVVPGVETTGHQTMAVA